MPIAAVALGGLAWVSFGFMLLGVVGFVSCIWSLSRLRQARRVIEAAERMERVSLRHVIRRYVPPALRSHHRAEEMLLAKQTIGARQPRSRRWAVASAVLVVCSAAVTALLAHRNLQAIRVAGAPVRTGDALTMIQGVWGWRADFSRSCSENPHSISVSSDHKRLSIHYARSRPAADFDVVSVQRDTIVLSAPGPGANPISIFIKLLTADTYIANTSYQPLETTGAIERCRDENTQDASPTKR
jgi:hypothetical protein